ncbi:MULTISPECIES: hypothetical protein [unclassified Methylobacterium]|jgi:hypothetical protein|uniref:hypothetical protein n=1 Tax=unclassified Methylobacterium TaxID=2615210 RepID=UPI00135544FE|nr:hypothetical protein [Methylobacterium sp. 2A]MWV26203.1 hypothetical protein [Methylobacterium sp. 2A]
MTRHAADLAIHTGTDQHPPDDFAEDVLCEMSNLDTQDTNVPGTIFVSTALGSHGPRVKWYPDRAGRTLPCLIVSIEAAPKVQDDFVRTPASRAAAPLVVAWVRLNPVALLEFWASGASWTRREVAAFLDGLHKLP